MGEVRKQCRTLANFAMNFKPTSSQLVSKFVATYDKLFEVCATTIKWNETLTDVSGIRTKRDSAARNSRSVLVKLALAECRALVSGEEDSRSR